MNKPDHLGLSILELSKTLIYEFWYDYVKPKYGQRTILSCIDTENFIVCTKTDDIYKDIAEDVETTFGFSNCKLDWLLPKRKNIKVIGLMKDKLNGKIMTIIFGLRVKTYSQLMDDGTEDKKAKDTKKCVIKTKLKFENYKHCLEATQLENKTICIQK